MTALLMMICALLWHALRAGHCGDKGGLTRLWEQNRANFSGGQKAGCCPWRVRWFANRVLLKADDSVPTGLCNRGRYAKMALFGTALSAY